MTRPLLTISEFARAVDLAPSALRYYHEAGLLPPTEVDPHTGYRYYTREQERRALLLSRLRAVGVPIETMRQVLAGPADQAVQLLEAQAASARTSAARTEQVVTELVAMLRAGQGDARVVIDVDGPELAAAMRAAAGFASHETPGLAVVLLDVRDGAVHVVATDRYRLLRWQVRATGSARQGERRAAVPVEQVPALSAWLERPSRAAPIACLAARRSIPRTSTRRSCGSDRGTRRAQPSHPCLAGAPLVGHRSCRATCR